MVTRTAYHALARHLLTDARRGNDPSRPHPLLEAVLASDVPLGHAKRPLAHTYVWDEDPIYPQQLLVEPVEYAVRQAVETSARMNSRTWGEFVARAGGTAEYYRERLREIFELDDVDEDDWDAEDRDVHRFDDDRPFDNELLEEIDFNHNLGVLSTDQTMVASLPTEILNRHARVAAGVWGELYAMIASERADEFVRAMRDQGYVMVHDPFLTSAQVFGGGSFEAVERHVAVYEEWEGMLRGVDT